MKKKLSIGLVFILVIAAIIGAVQAVDLVSMMKSMHGG